MNVSLTDELEALVQRKVDSGLYTSASEVIREGLRLLEQQDQLKEVERDALREGIQRGIAAAKAGKLVDGPEAVARVRKRAAGKRSQARAKRGG
jgi:antitoxin ParD1/3/4